MTASRPSSFRSLGVLVAAAIAAPAASNDDSMTLAEMAKRLRELENANQSLTQEVRDLKAADGDEWLTEERASQIRGIVTDVLADAETRTSYQSTGVTAGYNNGFFIASPDGGFSLKVQGLMQTRFTWSHFGSNPTSLSFPNQTDLEQDRWGWEIPNAELTFSGKMFDSSLEFMLRGNFSNDNSNFVTGQGMGGRGGAALSNPGVMPIQNTAIGESGSGTFRMMDAWMRANLSQDWAIRFGQFRLPFDREFLVYEAYLLACSRSVLSSHLGLGYSQGLELEYYGDSLRWKLAYSDGGEDNLAGDYLELVGTDPAGSPWYYTQASWAVTSRLEVKIDGLWEEFREMTSPRGDEFGVLLGAAVHYQQGQPYYSQGLEGAVQGTSLVNSSGVGGYNDWFNLTADATFNFGGASLFGSFYWSNVSSGAAIPNTMTPLGFNSLSSYSASSTNIYGFLVQGSMYVSDEWELFAQYEYGTSTGPFNLPNQAASGGGAFAPANYNLPGDLSLVTFGANYYLKGQNAKWTTDFGWSLNPVSYFWADPAYGLRATNSSNQFVLRTQFQLFF